MSIIFVIVKRYLTILHSIFIFFCVNKCSAQFINRHYVNFTQADGLPSNETYYIFRDSKNYMWMATDQGVIRYSGTSIDKYSLSDNIVFKIKEDKFGKIWFFTQTGRLSYFYKEKIFNYEYNDSIAKYIKTILITDAFIGDNNEIQINSIGGFNYNITDKGIITKKSYQPLHRFEALKFQITNSDNNYFSRSISHDSRIKDSLLLYFKGAHNDSVYRFFFGQTSYVQYGVEKNFSGDLFFYNSKYLIKIGPSGNYKIKQFDADILCVKPDSYGDIWVGLIKGGAHLLDNDLVENSKPLFLNKSITSIEFDYEKGVWLSTLESGVFYLKNLYAKPINGNQILDQPIFRLYNLNDSLLYFANSDGIYKRQNNKIAIVLKTKMITVNDLFVDNGNLFFTGIGPSLLVAKKETFYPENDLKNIFSFYSSHEISRYGESEFLINNHVQLRIFNYKFFLHNKKIDKSLTTINFPYISNIENLFIDNKKNIWVTSRRGLYKLNSINDTPKLFEPHKELFAKGVTYMQQLPNGLYILGLRFGGLIIMKDSSVVANISETSGLINNSVKYVLIDKDRLWIATANGISVVNFLSYSPLKYEVINIGKSKGLFNVVIYQLIKFKNNILAATSNGIYEIDDPGVYDNKKALPIPLYISNINYYKGDTVGVENLSVPYNKSRILIKYNCLCFNSPEEIKYYYRIAWSDSG